MKRADFQKRRVPEIGANPIEQTVAHFVGDHVSGLSRKRGLAASGEFVELETGAIVESIGLGIFAELSNGILHQVQAPRAEPAG